ncbi:MAG: efflux RND transporter periplasmic adaptor subunit [Rhodospirillaceae bacterium]|jgi:cobalt-zinc-cadmium efflux system membrane fusion protein
MNRNLIAAAIVVLAVAGIGYVVFSGKSEQTAAPQAAKEEEHKDEEGSIDLTPEKITQAGIQTEISGPVTIREVLPLYGTITPNAERLRDVSARFPGTIRSVTKKIGDTVRQGETLATVESNESLQAYAITAPLSGVLTTRNANPGEQTGEKVLFSVADLSAVWVELSLFPRDASKVRVGQQVRVKTADGGTVGDGSIVYIAPVGTTASQTRVARVLLDNADGQWAPGLYVTAEVVLGEHQVALAVRNAAIQNLEGGESVFVRTSDGFVARALKLGRSDGEYSEVLGGIKAGDNYATTNSYVLKAELGKGETEHGH